MSGGDYSARDVDRLVQRLQSDSLTLEDEAQLRDIIRNDPRGRRRVARQLAVMARLKEVFEISTIVERSEGSRTWLRGWSMVAVVVIAAVVVGLLAVSKNGRSDVVSSLGSQPRSGEVKTFYDAGKP